jgi:regulator of cell morphogenesis and NO signaling
VLDSLGIDYCCGGSRSLSEACAAAGVPLVTAIGLLDQADTEPTTAEETDWSAAYLAALVDHIVEKHHTFLRKELPRLDSLIQRVTAAHGQRHPELLELSHVFAAMASELVSHMLKEEHVLFPAIKRLEARSLHDPAAPSGPFLGLEQPIKVMEDEHRSAGDALRRIRWLTGDFQPPADACNTYLALMAGLQALEADLHQHIHKENNILFPRASKLQASLELPLAVIG